MKVAIVTGSLGLVGSAVSAELASRAWTVYGVDSQVRAAFFGPGAANGHMVGVLRDRIGSSYIHRHTDIRDVAGIEELIQETDPAAVVHCAGQPSHDWARTNPRVDWAINAGGTINLLEACREHAPLAAFVLMSTNKVYGDAPNRAPLIDLDGRRLEYDRDEARRPRWLDPDHGIGEDCPIDRSLHSLFGVSKAAADLMTQEYARTFGMRTVCLRAGCLTGPDHAGAELHGFLSYIVRCAVRGDPYTVHGYAGKQVRDQLDARDLAALVARIVDDPRPGEVYNIGGGRPNSASLIEVADMLAAAGAPVKIAGHGPERLGDHACWITDTRRVRSHYPGWAPARRLPGMVEEMVAAARARDGK